MCQSVKDAGVSGSVWEDCVCAGEGVGVEETVRDCQGDGQAGASLRGACAGEGPEAANVRANSLGELGGGMSPRHTVPSIHVSLAFSLQLLGEGTNRAQGQGWGAAFPVHVPSHV